MNDFYNGIIVGCVQTIVGHPFDTLKVLKQTSKNKLTYDKLNLLRLYKGVTYPLIGSGIYNSLQFGVHEKMYNSGYSHFNSGVVGGIVSSIVINPIDIYKINRQIIRKDKINPFRGFEATVLRESISNGLYFGSYYYVLDKLGGPSNFNSFISGGVSGIASWLFTYPLDVAKSRIMSYQTNTIIESLKMGNLWMGLEFCLLRAFVVNGCGFLVFNNLIDNIKEII